ncbi:uncharacterized protein MELLADRAFT_84382 [Melampsora larici-populina 98AG31]|uniref:Uncharacterized protein n=1 Tax=Melampsora larici-populina (strain 98AG31 / pathotype 3-4-7) TaxID=747676 RepID=F4RFK2_MELLP|nr:uncharacterized protein MELLADRAFT_84382 [Melampsora larici-populina 98AG31]EGG08822.1 hypothetical protein MELLADRAFT_84382 [Melampsora larici-populina 98AG31]
MGIRRQPESDAAYVNIPSDSRETSSVESIVENSGLKALSNFCQRAIWILAGSTLIGFALCTLWWDPIVSDEVQQENPQSNNQPSIVQEECNPFQQLGYLHYNQTDYGDNTWRPYQKECRPSNLFSKLKQDLLVNSRAENDERFKWLQNRTLVLIGDSIERWHLFDFCTMLNEAPGSTEESPIFLNDPPAETYYINADSPLSPKPFHFDPIDPTKPPSNWPVGEEDLFKFQSPIWESGKNNPNTTRPRVCRIEKYGFTAVNLFTWGLEPKNGGRIYANISGYYPPAEYTSRVTNIMKPLLTNLAEHYKNPNIEKPDLIEMASGFWDLRQWGEEDFEESEEEPNSYSPIAFTDLDQGRLNWWSTRMKRAVRFVSQNFPENQTPILWRSLHHTQRHYWVAFNRVFQLDQLARYNIQQLKSQDSVLKDRLRVDESGYVGALMLGQEHHFRDVLHLAALPGAVLWADIILWELKRAVLRRNYTHYQNVL